MQHETLPLKEEKQYIREIKQVKQLREQLSSSLGKQDEVQQALDQKDHIEERSKVVFSNCLLFSISYVASMGDCCVKLFIWWSS